MLIRDLIATAFRKARIIASGETPAAEELIDALAMLQALILEHPGLGNAAWRDVYASSDTTITAYDGQRITVGAWSPVINMPTVNTWGGCSQAVMDLSRIKIIGGTQAGVYLFADVWRRADALTPDSENPFGADADNGLASQLAVRMAEDYGAQIGPNLMATAMRSEKNIRGRLYRDRCHPFWDDYQFPQPGCSPFDL